MEFVELKLTGTGKSIWVCLSKNLVPLLSADLISMWKGEAPNPQWGPKYSNCWYVSARYKDDLLTWLQSKPAVQVKITESAPLEVKKLTPLSPVPIPSKTAIEQIIDQHIHTLMAELPHLKERQLYNLITDRMSFLLGKERF